MRSTDSSLFFLNVSVNDVKSGSFFFGISATYVHDGHGALEIGLCVITTVRRGTP